MILFAKTRSGWRPAKIAINHLVEVDAGPYVPVYFGYAR